jgi:hypothetical protein
MSRTSSRLLNSKTSSAIIDDNQITEHDRQAKYIEALKNNTPISDDFLKDNESVRTDDYYDEDNYDDNATEYSENELDCE